jgi:signal transduction histidine kinase
VTYSEEVSVVKEGRQALREHPYVADAVIAAVLYLLMLTTPGGAPQRAASLSAGYIVVGAVVCGALVFRRRWPLWVLVVTVAGALVRTVLERSGAAGSPFLVASSLAVFTFALTSRRSAGLAGGAITALVLFCGDGLWVPGSWWDAENVGVLAWIGMAVAAGDALRNRRAYVAAVRERARRSEEAREQEAGRRVVEERLRIARELHDVVAHHIAVILVQAGVAAHMLHSQPMAVEGAIGHVRREAGEVLDELGTLLGVLRQSGDEPAGPDAPSEPAPSLSRLDALVRSFSEAGLCVDSVSSGLSRALPAAVDLTAYRLVQESLTNAHKHGGDRAQVTLEFQSHQLVVEVCNKPLPGVPQPAVIVGTGYGLVGMRERVLAVGGWMEAGPTPEGGFRVRALLPTPEADPEAQR